MNSRERVRAVINHKIPDRVPMGLGGCETAGLHLISYDKLCGLLGGGFPFTRLNTFMCNAVFEREVLDRIGADIILLESPKMCRSKLWGNDNDALWCEQKLWGRTYRISSREKFTENSDGSLVWNSNGDYVCPAGSYFFDTPESTDLLKDFDYISPDNYNPPSDYSDKFLRSLEDSAKMLYNDTEFSICLGESITDLQVAPGGLIGSMVLMMSEPEVMHEFLAKACDAGLSQLKLLDQAVGKYVDILSIAHDFGDNRGVTIGAPLWREVYKTHYMKLFKGWHEITKMKVNMHSCGSVEQILGDLIECGLDIYNPVQISADNMAADSLKERFGDSLVFWGGDYDAQLCVGASPNDVYNLVSKNLQTLKIGGGHIFSGVHNLPPDVSAQHLSAILKAYSDNKDYSMGGV